MGTYLLSAQKRLEQVRLGGLGDIYQPRTIYLPQ